MFKLLVGLLLVGFGRYHEFFTNPVWGEALQELYILVGIVLSSIGADDLLNNRKRKK